jgi:antibiotic biosynthesis monooxygenase (ABM) superfamily enzyme
MSAHSASAAPDSADEAAGPRPALAAAPRVLSRPRFALLVFAGVYPLVTALLYLIAPLTRGWMFWQQTLVIVPVVVVTMVWGLIPFLHRRFSAFLHPVRRPSAG